MMLRWQHLLLLWVTSTIALRGGDGSALRSVKSLKPFRMPGSMTTFQRPPVHAAQPFGQRRLWVAMLIYCSCEMPV
jgi:hypothetical protein